jgi:hypothetical protein
MSFEKFHIIRERVTGEMYLESLPLLTAKKLERFEIISPVIDTWFKAWTQLHEMKKDEVILTGGIFDTYERQMNPTRYGDPDGMKPRAGAMYKSIYIANNNREKVIYNFVVDKEFDEALYDCRVISPIRCSFTLTLYGFQQSVICKERSLEWVNNWERQYGLRYPIPKERLTG